MQILWDAGAGTTSQPLGIQLLVAAVGPTLTAILGGLAVGLLLRYADSKTKKREHDRDLLEQQALRDREELERTEAIRRDFISRFSSLAYPMHYTLEHYARSVRHKSGSPEILENLAREIERQFVADRGKLGALQYEIDAFYDGFKAGDGLHRATDLLMVKYMRTMPVSPDQRRELEANVIPSQKHQHTGLSLEQLADPETVDSAFALAVKETLDGLLTERVRPGAFSSSKLLTGPDGSAAGGTGDGSIPANAGE